MSFSVTERVLDACREGMQQRSAVNRPMLPAIRRVGGRGQKRMQSRTDAIQVKLCRVAVGGACQRFRRSRGPDACNCLANSDQASTYGSFERLTMRTWRINQYCLAMFFRDQHLRLFHCSPRHRVSPSPLQPWPHTRLCTCSLALWQSWSESPFWFGCPTRRCTQDF